MAEVDVDRECRICRGEDEPGRPLLHPCRCSGSIKYTHEDCLINWLAQSGSSRCELCNHSFRFEPLYQPNTPSALPTREFLTGVLVLLKKTIKTAARIILVCTVWLFFLPIGTCWTWYLLFINSPMQLPALLASRGPAGIVTDAFYGFLLSAGIVFVFLGVSSLREYVRQLPQDAAEHEHDAFQVFHEDEDRHVHHDALHHDADNENEWPEHENDQMNDGDGVAQPLRNRVGDGGVLDLHGDNEVDQEEDLSGELVDEVDELVRDTYDFFIDEHNENDMEDVDSDIELDDNDDRPRSDGGGDMHGYPAGESDAYASSSDYMEEEDFEEVVFQAHAMENRAQRRDINGAEGDRPDDVEDDDQDVRGEGGALFGLFELDPDEVPLEEVVGLRGHIRNLFDNAGTVLVSNAIFLGIFTLIPLLIGRLALRLFSVQSFPIRITDITQSLSPHFLISLVSQSSSLSLSGTTAIRNITTTLNVEGSPSASVQQTSQALSTGSILNEESQTLINESLIQSAREQDQPLVSYIDNFFIVLLGYGMIALVSVAYIGSISLLRHRYPRLDSPITRQIARMLRYIATLVKIVVLILFEFGVFPLGCGWWLDICTLELFGGTTQSRLAYCRQSPWTCTGGHWVLGIVYMAHISLFISLLREVLRPELLWFLRNPDDPEFHPFRELVEKPLSRHARRMCLSIIIYVPLIMALVYIPGQLCLKLLPHVFPFRSEDFSHILIDVPFGNLLIGPLIRLLYFGRPELSLQLLLSAWVRGLSSVLGIRDLVVKGETVNENQPPNAGRDAQHPLPPVFAPVPGVRFEAAGTSGDMDDDFIEEDQDQRKYIGIRAVLMIAAAWATLVVVESFLLAMPTILGRRLMSTVGLAVRHDLHPFLLGLNVLLGTVNGMCKLVRYFRTLDTMTMITMSMPYLALVVKGTVIISIWLGIIPLMTGLLFELIFVPIRVSYNETPYFCLHQDWALGLLLLKVWSCIAATGGLGTKWRERVLRAKEGELAGLDVNFSRTMREVVLPVLVWSLMAPSLEECCQRWAVGSGFRIRCTATLTSL
eukprot:gb/GEZJ01000350.1/.p1 GENE.gb/GEZJ01000350.1/~~gb/GEZJ01000350.1/.p1  ORF type:complete len:1051 (-),score=144.27 gb/GEZJ01000350.1/:1268-4420(-)